MEELPQSTVSPPSTSLPADLDTAERVVYAISDLYAEYVSNFPDKEVEELTCSQEFFERNLELMPGGADSEVELLAENNLLEQKDLEEAYTLTEKGEEAFESVHRYRLETDELSGPFDWLEADYRHLNSARELSDLPI